jgi:hydrogenase maturation factor
MSLFVARLLEIAETDEGREGTVSVRGARLLVALDAVPEAGRGDYVLVEAGVALARLENDEEGRPCV